MRRAWNAPAAPYPAIALLLLGALCLASGCAKTLEQLPTQLLGVWVSDAPQYARSYLELRPQAIQFGMDSVAVETAPIQRIHVHRGSAHQTIYELRYPAQEGYDETLVVTYIASVPPQIRVGGRSDLWHRRAAP